MITAAQKAGSANYYWALRRRKPRLRCGSGIKHLRNKTYYPRLSRSFIANDLCKTIFAGRSWHVIARPLVTGPEAKEPMAPRHRKARAVSIPRFARGAAVRRRAGEAGRGRDRRERALDHRYWNDRRGLCCQHSCGRAAVSDRQAEASHARLVCVVLDAIRRASRPRRALVHLPDNSPSCAV